jgi:hypothetical protein
MVLATPSRTIGFVGGQKRIPEDRYPGNFTDQVRSFILPFFVFMHGYYFYGHHKWLRFSVVVGVNFAAWIEASAMLSANTSNGQGLLYVALAIAAWDWFVTQQRASRLRDIRGTVIDHLLSEGLYGDVDEALDGQCNIVTYTKWISFFSWAAIGATFATMAMMAKQANHFSMASTAIVFQTFSIMSYVHRALHVTSELSNFQHWASTYNQVIEKNIIGRHPDTVD